MTVWEMLDEAAARLDTAFEDQPALEATVRLAIGQAYESQGRHEEARHHLERVVALVRDLEASDASRFADASFALVITLESVGDLDAAASACDEGLGQLDDAIRNAQDDDPERIRGLRAQRATGLERLASVRIASSDFEAAASALREATQILHELHGENSDELATAHNNLGALYWHLARYDDAERSYRSAIDSLRAIHGDRHPSVATTLGNLAVVLKSAGHIDEAEPLYHESLEVFRHAYGETHPHIANTLNNIARVHEARGDLQRAESMFREALAMRIAIHGDEHFEVAAAMHNLGTLLQLRDEWTEAEDVLQRAFEMRRRLLGDHASVAESHLALASAAEQRGDSTARLEHLREAVRIRRTVFGPGSYLGFALLELGHALVEEGSFEPADSVLAEGVALMRRAAPESRDAIARGLYDRAHALEGRGSSADAILTARECLAIRREIHPPDSPAIEAAEALLERLDTD